MNNIYQINITDDLRSKSGIKIEKKKVAFLVPNMFNKVASGYEKKETNLKPTVGDVADVISEEPVEAANNDVNAVVPVSEEANAPEVEEEVVETGKPYQTKVTDLDLIFLQNTKMTMSSSPKKLLISAVFIQKLISHRTKDIEIEKASKPEPEPEEVKAPAFEADPKAEAVKKYVEFMNKRKEAIKVKQECEKEMTALVNEFSITLDMVNAELARQGGKEVA